MPSPSHAPGPHADVFGGVWQKQAPLDLLSGILPNPTTTAFLLACLAPPPLALEAWQRWRAPRSPLQGLVGADADLRGLSAALATALFAAGAALDREDATWLRAALLHEQQRCRRYRQILAEVLATLSQAGVPFLLSRGAAVAETVLPQPWLRHCHDADLLVPQEHLSDAAAVLAQAGLREQPVRQAGRSFLHRRGLPIRLHARLLPPPFEGPAIGAIHGRASSLSVLGTTVRRPAADDLLLHITAHAVCSPSRLSARWVGDAHAVVVGRERPDWDRLRQTAAASGLSAPLAVTLGYLADAIGTPVPAATLAGLTADASVATRLDRNLLIHAARLGGGSWLADLWRNSGGRSRLTFLRWTLAPDRAYIARVDAEPGLIPLRQLVRHWRRIGADLVMGARQRTMER